MARHDAHDCGTAASPSNKMHRLVILASHTLHWISSLIVMSIAAYLISKFSRNTHLVYWVTIATIDVILYIPAIILPASNKYKGFMWPLAWIFSYFWLTAFIFATQDYNSSPSCWAYSPSFVNKCSLKKTLEAFAFIAFFTNLVGALLERRLYDIQRSNPTHNAYGDRYAAGHISGGPLTAQPVV